MFVNQNLWRNPFIEELCSCTLFFGGSPAISTAFISAQPCPTRSHRAVASQNVSPAIVTSCHLEGDKDCVCLRCETCLLYFITVSACMAVKYPSDEWGALYLALGCEWASGCPPGGPRLKTVLLGSSSWSPGERLDCLYSLSLQWILGPCLTVYVGGGER